MQLDYFRVSPTVVTAGKETAVTIRCLDSVQTLTEGEEYLLEIYPMEGGDPVTLGPTGFSAGTLRFTHTFEQEQEHCILLRKPGEKAAAELRMYCVAQDLSGLYPMKGAMHCHSLRSDGLESPAVVAACYRGAGFDYCAITDHRLYEPSLEAMEVIGKLDSDFKLFPGEEVHTPDNRVHIVHFGGSQSVNSFCREHEEIYRAEVAALQAELGCAYDYAASQWAFGKIREYGGMSILCHPSWVTKRAYNIPADMLRRFLREGGFDVLELINGGNTHPEQNHQITFWMESLRQGRNIPAVGTDDSHGAINGKWFHAGWTYVLAPACEKDALITAMRRGLCTAVEGYHGETARFYGEPRIVRYCEFLHRYYFPLQTRLCEPEGRWMLEHLTGDPSASKRVAALKGQTAELRKQFFDWA